MCVCVQAALFSGEKEFTFVADGFTVILPLKH